MSSTEESPSLRTPQLCAAVGIVGALLAHVLYGASGHDDPHITYWAAHALAHYGEIVNHSGARVEQSSSLLHTVVIALGHLLTGIEIPMVGHFVGVLAGVLTCGRLPVALPKQSERQALAGAALIASSPLWLYWTVGGLETSLQGWLFLEFVIASQAWIRSGPGRQVGAGARLTAILVCFVACRPEGPLVACSTLLAAAAVQAVAQGSMTGGSVRDWLSAFAMAVAASTAVTIFRVTYFGSAMPQPVVAKMGGGFDVGRLIEGASYLASYFGRVEALPLLFGLALATTAVFRSARREDPSFVIPLVAWSHICFVFLVGGDWMTGSRFMVPVVPVMSLALVSEVSSIPRLGRRTVVAALATVLCLNVVAAVRWAAQASTGCTIWRRPGVFAALETRAGGFEYTFAEKANLSHGRDVVMIDDLDALVSEVIASEGHAKIMSFQAGMVMYHITRRHYGQVDFLDRGGLVDRRYDQVAKKYGVSRNRLGLDWKQAELFDIGDLEPDVVRAELFEPDIIFDLYRNAERAARTRGYVTVYVQSGTLRGWPHPSLQVGTSLGTGQLDEAQRELSRTIARRSTRARPRFGHARRDVYQFIAIRRDLAVKLGLIDERGTRLHPVHTVKM